MVKKIKYFIAELFIVFIGVFLAFQFSNYKEQQSAKQLEQNYYKTLLHEMENSLADFQFARNEMEIFLQLVQEKKRPNPGLLRKLNLAQNLYVLQSAFNAGYFENLDTSFISNLSSGANQISKIDYLFNQYNALVGSALVATDFDHSNFYNEESTLKEKYHWVTSDLSNLIVRIKNIENAITKGAIPGIKSIIK